MLHVIHDPLSGKTLLSYKHEHTHTRNAPLSRLGTDPHRTGPLHRPPRQIAPRPLPTHKSRRRCIHNKQRIIHADGVRGVNLTNLKKEQYVDRYYLDGVVVGRQQQSVCWGLTQHTRKHTHINVVSVVLRVCVYIQEFERTVVAVRFDTNTTQRPNTEERSIMFGTHAHGETGEGWLVLNNERLFRASSQPWPGQLGCACCP